MKLNTKKTVRECECTCHLNPLNKTLGKVEYCSKCIRNHKPSSCDCTCHTNWKAGIHGKYACPGCQPTENYTHPTDAGIMDLKTKTAIPYKPTEKQGEHFGYKTRKEFEEAVVNAVRESNKMQRELTEKPMEETCGIKHEHNYDDCCAACYHGEYPGEGASGHVINCIRYKPKVGVSSNQQSSPKDVTELREYKQKLLKKKEELRKEGFDSGCDDAGCPCSKIQFTDYDRGFNDCLDEVEAVIKEV